jgi:hypothetical protein
MDSNDSVKMGFPAIGIDAIAILMNDHQRIKALLRDLPHAAEAERPTILERLKAALTIHHATEENLIYPALRDIAKRPIHAKQLYHQQNEAKVALWELTMMDHCAPDFSIKATELEEAILAHVREEEESEFPHLREEAGAELARLTADVRAFRNAFIFRSPALR